MQRLYEIGFQRAGRWLLKDDELALELLHLSDRQNVLYAFISENTVKYVGKTTQTLQRRMFGYQRPNKDQRTNWRNRLAIVELLNAGHTVEILALADTGLLRYGAFHLNLAGGLEDSIINIVKPEWNGGRTSTVIEEPTEANPPDTSPEAMLEKQVVEAVAHPARPHQDEQPLPVTIEAITLDDTIPVAVGAKVFESQAVAAAPHFILTLHDAYYKRGFFNAPVSVERYFGKNRTPITIYCGKEKLMVAGMINRTANTNGTPRIMGSTPLREWFQKRNHMSRVKVSIPEPNTIYLLED